MRTAQSKDTSVKSRRKSKRKSPKKIDEDFQRLMLGTISDGKADAASFRQPVMSARTNERYRPNATISRHEQTLNMFDENYRPNGQSIVSNPGEIYTIISGLVDQKFAERQMV